MENVKVSIVVPIYNTSRYLKECLDSLLGQTLQDIEIICVNDGSTDESLLILEEYQKRDERIRIINKENSGYGNTMNVGMDAAIGEYIGIVESDDYIQLDMMEKLYEVAGRSKIDFIKSDYYFFWGDGETRIRERANLFYDESLYGRVLKREEIKYLVRGYIANPTGIYRSDFLSKKKIRHNESPGASYQDLGFFFQVLMHAEEGYLLKENFYMYRQDNENSSVNNKAKVFCNCDEYEFVYGKLKETTALAKEYISIFQFFRFAGYKYTFSRIADEFRLEFLERVKKDYIESEEKGELDLSFLMDWEMQEFEMMYKNSMQYYKTHTALSRKLFEKIKTFDEVIIYGAGGKGTEVYEALRWCLKDFKYVSFAVTKVDSIQQTKFGVPVKSIYELQENHKDAIVIVAVTALHQDTMLHVLANIGFTSIITLDEVMNEYE